MNSGDTTAGVTALKAMLGVQPTAAERACLSATMLAMLANGGVIELTPAERDGMPPEIRALLAKGNSVHSNE